MYKQDKLAIHLANGRIVTTDAVYPEMQDIYKSAIADLCRVFDSYCGDTATMNSLARGEPLPKVTPSASLTHFEYHTQAQRVALLKKGFLLNPVVDPEVASLRTFLDCELSNKLVNEKFRMRAFTFEERTLLERARALCYRILGPSPGRLHLSFTTGASVLLKAKDAHFINKMRLPLEVSKTSGGFVKEALHRSGAFAFHLALCQGAIRRHKGSIEVVSDIKFVEVPHTEVFFVDKTSDTKRICMKERTGDMLLQRGYGKLIARSLKNYSGDLEYRPSKHKWLCEQHFAQAPQSSSYYNDLYKIATLDITNASNCLSYELVRFLLPPIWFDALTGCRSKSCTLPDGSVHKLEMFSSNGNGYTFELETLIFECLALSVREAHGQRHDRVSVFGDDIIVAEALADPLIELLSVCGFITNNEKTFKGDVPFRESCGYDCFKGQAARPIYFKGNPSEENWVSLLYNLANSIHALLRDWPLGSISDIWADIIDGIPPWLRVGGPREYGNLVLHGLPESKDKYGRQYILAPYGELILPTEPDAVLAYALANNPSTGLSPRARIPQGFKVLVTDKAWQPEAVT